MKAYSKRLALDKINVSHISNVSKGIYVTFTRNNLRVNLKGSLVQNKEDNLAKDKFILRNNLHKLVE